MSLRLRTLLILLVTLAGLTGLTHVLSRTVFLESFLQQEQQAAERDAGRAESALAERLDRLDAAASSFASSDELYRYIGGRDPAYAALQFGDGAALASRGLSAIALYDTAGHLVLSRAVDIETGKFVPSPAAFDAGAEVGRVSPALSDMRPVKGYLDLAGTPARVSLQPVRGAFRARPPLGAIVCLRALDAGEEQRLSQALQQDVAVVAASDPQLKPEIRDAGDRTVVRTAEETISATKVLEGIDGRPALVLHSAGPRSIRAAGLAATRRVMLFSLLAAAFTACVGLVLLERSVLSRLVWLTRQVEWVRSRRDPRLRVEASGSDEVARVAGAINGALEALSDTMGRYRAVLDNAADAILLVDVETRRIVEANDGCRALIGYAPRELFGRELDSLVVDGRDRLGPFLDATVNQGSQSPCDVEVTTKDDVLLQVELRAHVVPGGARSTVCLIARDVHERRRAERELRRRDAILFTAERILAASGWRESLPGILERLGEVAEVTRVYLVENVESDGARHLARRFEWAAEGLEPQLLDPAVQSRTYAAAGMAGWDEPLRRGEAVQSVISEMTPDNRDALEVAGASAVLAVPVHVNGRYWGFLGLEDGLSERRWPSEEVEALQAATTILGAAIGRHEDDGRMRLQAAALEAAQNGIAIIDRRGEVRWANAAFCSMTGRTRQEVAGRRLDEHEVHGPELSLRDLLLHVASGDPWRGEVAEKRKDGTVVWFEETLAAVKDGRGEVASFVTVRQDVTERREAGQKLEREKNDAEAGARAKGEFLATLSHEIRTPMNAIIGMTELALKGTLTPETREYVSVVRTASMSLLEIINDVLDFSKIDAGHIEFERAAFGVRECLTDALRLAAPRALTKGLDVAMHVSPDVPQSALGDRGRLKQVLGNLLANAVKFTERGSIVVEVSRRETGSGELELEFAVRDTGCGIDPARLERIFEPFAGTDHTQDAQGGTGLGLPISMRLVQRMGGRIWVESRPGEGSTFRFTARFGTAPSPGAGTPLAGRRALVVERAPEARRAVETLLREWGAEVTGTADGVSALHIATVAAHSDARFDVMAFDPATEGLDVDELLLVAAKDATLVEMVTPGATPPARPGARRILRPVGYHDLLRAVTGAALPDADEGLAAPARGPGRALRILVAEDDILNQRFIVRLLEKRGHRVTLATDGQAVLEAWRRETFDLLLMDVQMPGMDGFAATRAIRAEERGTERRTPIVAMTAHALAGDRDRCLAEGMDAYLPKPLEVAELDALLASVAPQGPAAVGVSR